MTTAFITDLGSALETAFKAGSAHFGTILGNTGGVLHVEYSDQPITWPKGATGRCTIRDEGYDTIEEFDTSARSVFRFVLEFELKDVRGKKRALSVALAACRNVLANGGATVLDTHFTDTSSKRLGGSGRIAFDPVVADAGTLEDDDEPVVQVRVSIDITHGVPL